MKTLDERVKLTLDYLNSPAGIHNWFENHRRGYDRRMNVLAAVQTATRLLTWERIEEVYKAVEAVLFNRGAVA
jgi:ActR/RegA family two-component response regulator